MAAHQDSERRPLLEREPLEDVEDAFEGKRVDFKASLLRWIDSNA